MQYLHKTNHAGDKGHNTVPVEVQHHPLVAVGAAAVARESLHPGVPGGGQSVRHHSSVMKEFHVTHENKNIMYTDSTHLVQHNIVVGLMRSMRLSLYTSSEVSVTARLATLPCIT